MLKKVIALSVSVVFAVMSIFTTAYAANTQIVSETVTASDGETISIPISISGNAGIMGYRISIRYSADAFSQPEVTRGTVCVSGNFNDSIDEETNGSFDVLWSDSKNISANGELFTVTFKVNSSAVEKTTISVSYSQADTFNESWENVILDCEDIDVLLNGYSETPEPEPEPEPQPAEKKLSEKIREWAQGLASPFNTIMEIIVAPVVFVISLFE